MKYLGEVVRTVTVPAFYTLILITPILLTSCKSKDKNSHGLNDVWTSPENSGLIQKLEQRKQLYKELLGETSGSTK
ncbi:uncharacterized protein PSSP7_020A [Prochlorococcus phage P-SSP7]|uniref:Lipoprotein n=1 Tax=Prochlorococcus phage P-SSP7 TaxID=2908095 RepID=I3RYR6_BPPRP|nr:uncharacterized protein PSSP7_020A [Prochlorococcus phage P-SSP7]AFK33158.1 uncharacterized protein PSSP7_020A [Prochlorococcus phage P-SSP7]